MKSKSDLNIITLLYLSDSDSGLTMDDLMYRCMQFESEEKELLLKVNF